jgi:sarcosine oxidase
MVTCAWDGNKAQMRTSELDGDLAVVGLGAMGANAAWRLAMRGVRVIGIERFHPGHVQGSSHGHTRVFRVACLEHPNLVPLARRSRELWTELQVRSGTPVIRSTGAVMIGPRNSRVISGTLAAAAEHGLPVTRLSREELQCRFPQHQNLAEDHVAVWDPEAGLVHPEAGIIAAVDAARDAGASIYTDTRVTGIELVEGGAVVRTATRDFRVAQVVVTTGAWLNKLVPSLPLKPLRTPMMWFKPKRDGSDAFTLEQFPVFIRAVDPENWIWGHGAGDGFGVKIGPDMDPNFHEVDPDTINRGISEADWRLVSKLIATALPDLDPTPILTTTCMVTHSPDLQFQIGRPGRDPRLIVGGGCSGHAFKHASGIGELIAQIASHEAPLVSLDFIDPDRFAQPPAQTAA